VVKRAVSGAQKRHRTARCKNRHYSRHTNDVKIFPLTKTDEPANKSNCFLQNSLPRDFARPPAQPEAAIPAPAQEISLLLKPGTAT
jgi:hypothetical protein